MPADTTAAGPARELKARRIAAPLALGALVLGYPVLLHELIASGRWPGLTVLAGLLPMLGVLALLALRGGRRWLAPCVLVAGGALGWHWRAALQGNFAWIHLLQHLGMQLFLCWLFARTLSDGRTALITQLATRLRGPLTPQLIRYTRSATLAWAMFFALDAAASLLLFATAPLSVWSLFANVLTWPLVAAMFIGEYAVRRLAHPEVEHVPITAGIRAFWSRPHDAPRSGDAATAAAPAAAGRPPCPR